MSEHTQAEWERMEREIAELRASRLTTLSEYEPVPLEVFQSTGLTGQMPMGKPAILRRTIEDTSAWLSCAEVIPASGVVVDTMRYDSKCSSNCSGMKCADGISYESKLFCHVRLHWYDPSNGHAITWIPSHWKARSQ